ncbi:MAG: 1,4-dihydroxy-2-naphthoate octaprenyltransferase [Prevotella sp.]|nr:1,4-dihydroxy-2-naphthoate octaprenyltransferase [Prevotella sp.]
MDNDIIKINSPKSWLLAARPKTLSAAAVPVLIATALAWKKDGGESFHCIAAVLCFLFAFIMQIDANFINDYFDFKRGNDDETRLGPKRACAEGWVSDHAMLWAICITTVLACFVGLPLVLYGGMDMMMVGVLCVVFCFLYTTTLSYMALGDVLVLVFFGIVPVCCTYYVELSRAFNPLLDQTVWMSVACGLVIDTLLIINNYRDYDNDRRANKKTLAVMIGRKAIAAVYLLIVPVALAINLCCTFTIPMIVSCVIILALHFMSWRKMMKIGEGKELNSVLGLTARNILLYGILTSITVILS